MRNKDLFINPIIPINFREIPLVRLLLPFLLGIISAYHLEVYFEYLTWIIILLAPLFYFLAKASINYRNRWVTGVFAYLFIFLFGYWCGQPEYKAVDNQHFQTYLHQQKSTVRGTVIATPKIGKRVRVQLAIDAIRHRDLWHSVDGKLLSYIHLNKKSLALQLGDTLFMNTNIQEIEVAANPGQIDFQTYYRNQQIYHQAFVDSTDWSLTPTSNSRIYAIASKARNYASTVLKKHLSSTNEYAVANALILGQKSDLTKELKNAYADTGAMHVLAVSGLHVGIVYGLLLLIFRLFPNPGTTAKLIKLITALLVMWGFVLLTGASNSVIRAATMFSFVAIGKNFNRYTNIYNTLAASAFLMLLFNPLALFDIGFQLSYLAVFSIVYFQKRIYRLWIPDNNIIDNIWKLITVSIAAQIGVFPLSLFYFHQFPLYFWLSGIIVVSAAGIILALGLALIALGQVPVIGAIIGGLLYWIIWMVNALIFLIQQLPGGLWDQIWISGIAVILMYLFISISAAAFRWRKPALMITGLFIGVLLSFGFSMSHISKLKSRQITIYKIPGYNLVDFIAGEQRYSFESPELPVAKKTFASSGWRSQFPIRDTIQLNLFGDQQTYDQLATFGPLIQFYDFRLINIDRTFNLNQIPAIPVDAILLGHNTRTDLTTLYEKINFKLVIIGSSNGQKTRQKWINWCEENQINYWDINQQGAWNYQVD